MESHHSHTSENTNTFDSDEILLDSVEFIRIFYILKKSKWLILLIFISSTIGGYLFLRYTKPVFQSISLLKLDVTKNSDIFGLGSKQGEDENIFGEIELIRSELVQNELINRLTDIRVSYQKQGKVISEEKFRNSPFKVTYPTKKANSLEDKEIHVLFNNNNFDLWFEKGNTKTSGTFNTPITFIGSKFTLSKTSSFTPSNDIGSEYTFIIHSDRALKKYLTQGLSVRPVNISANTIEVSFTDENKYKAAAIVNTIDSVYLEKTIEKKQLDKHSAIEFITQQLVKTRSLLDIAEQNIEDFTKENGIADISSQQNSIAGTLDQLLQKKIELSTREKTLEKFNTSTDFNDPSKIIALSLITDENPILTSLINEFENKQKSFKKLQTSHKKNTSAYQQSKNDLTNIREKIISRLIAYKNLIEKESDENKQEIYTVKKKLEQFPSLKAAFNKLERNYELYERFYLSLEEKKVEFGIAKAGIIPKFTILSPANIPYGSIYPKKQKIYAISLGIALVLSILLLFFKYLAYNTIISLRELEKLTKLPIIGTVPEFKMVTPHSSLVVHQSPKSSLSESLRSIRTNLDYFESAENSKVVCFTSTISGEGKTFISTNLGGILAMSENKVVILDLDMRKPKVHKAFAVENGVGMSDILIGKANYTECIHQSEIENLHFITSGAIPPNPSELIMRKEMDQLMADLSKTYQFIFIDSPPAGLVTDAHILMKKCAVSIYVIKAGYSSRNVVKGINRMVNQNKFHNFTVVLNAAKQIESYKTGYGGYGYGYGGNGYGYYEETDPKPRIFQRIKRFFTS
ncbi:MAG: GumC family protein [Cyclobacteriaceae bacterium]